MSILGVPENGLLLECSESNDYLPAQAFGITLNDSVIEDMIRCVQNGQEIELFLGNNPTLQYGNEEEPLKPTTDCFDYDLYLTNLVESATKAQRLPNPTMSILKRPTIVKGSKPNIRVEKAPTDSKKSSKGAKTRALPGKSAMAMALSNAGSARSMPTSPALNGVASPSHNPAFTVTQQLVEKNKEQRSTLVHELAVRDQTFDYLKDKWTGSEADLKTTLSKVADPIGDKWSMKKLYWKELDVWNYHYKTSEDRQAAIDHAIKQYDKQRLGTTAPEWERLLKEEDRGKGVVLSKLQATLARGNITPAPKPSKAEDSSKNSSDESVKGRSSGEIMARSNSQPGTSKPRAKVSDREMQSKNLMANKPVKKPIPAPKKVISAAPKAKTGEKPSGKVFKSAEFVEDSSSDDEAPLATSNSVSNPKPVEKTVERSLERLPDKPPAKKDDRSAPLKTEEKSPLPPPAAKPKAKPIIRAPRPAPSKVPATTTAQKRPHEDDDSSSSSGAPLSKRTKPKEAGPKSLTSTTTLKHRPSDTSQNSRVTPPTLSAKSKNTSPAKSSPLASSPPTNASDFDERQSQSQHQNQSSRPNGVATTNGANGISAKKRPAVREPEPQSPPKKLRVSKDVLNKAHLFDKFYESYKKLHEGLTKMANPPQEKLDDLLDMRQRLVTMKAEIRQAVGSAA
ncbi:hypothetical protein BX600DRAFT_505796 [Xylariales sp. PMI_506]|nr:hypothetical protein BX600DRAFT_505796 [Xylariales sp. PMI_506]